MCVHAHVYLGYRCVRRYAYICTDVHVHAHTLIHSNLILSVTVRLVTVFLILRIRELRPEE